MGHFAKNRDDVVMKRASTVVWLVAGLLACGPDRGVQVVVQDQADPIGEGEGDDNCKEEEVSVFSVSLE